MYYCPNAKIAPLSPYKTSLPYSIAKKAFESKGKRGVCLFTKNKRFRLCDEIAMAHLSEEAFDTGLIRSEEVLSVNQYAYLSGVLSKRNSQYVLTYSNTCKLTISSKELNSLNVNYKL